MKLKFLAVGFAPTRYEISGEIITAFEKYVAPPDPLEPVPEPDPDAPPPEESILEAFDLSLLQFGGEFLGVEPAVIQYSSKGIQLPATEIIRDAWRDDLGELHVVLCQETQGKGDWIESDWLDSAAFVPSTQYIYKRDEPNPLAPAEPQEPIT